MADVNPDAPLGQLLTELAQKTGLLVRQEVELAKTEMTTQAVRAARDMQTVGAGGALAHAGLVSVFAAIILALGLFIPTWLAALLLGIVALAAGYALIRRGTRSLRSIDPVPRTRESVRNDKALLQEQIR